MNHTIQTRSALVRAAESGLMVRNRPATASGIVFAEETGAQQKRRAQRRRDSAVIFSVCAVVVGAYLLVQFIAQVMSA
jgi:hypothetical protein